MPSFGEIYSRHAEDYDELVSHEDYRRNLAVRLDELFDFRGKTVIEPGTGTGRLTKLYIEKACRAHCLDLSSHMLERAALNLASYRDKIVFDVRDNLSLHTLDQRADFVIEGWSFGHCAAGSGTRLEFVTDYLVANSLRLLIPGGTAIFIETLGTDVDEPGAPGKILSDFYGLLENRHGFTREIVATDYRFTDYGEAARIMGNFFGDAMRSAVEEKQERIIPEFTGIWHKSKQ